MDKNQTIGSILLIVFGIAVILFGKYGGMMMVGCEGLGWLNPICWGKGLLNLTFFIFALIIGSLLIIGGIIGFFSPQAIKWYVGFMIFFVFALVSWLVPDFLPFVDEFLFTIGTIFFGIKTITAEDKKKTLGVF